MREVWKLVFFVSLLFLSAAQIEPESITVQGGPEVEFSEVITITNTQARPVQYTLGLSQFSQYLSDAVQPTQDTFGLQPQESKNIQVTGTVPLLGPETHKLVYELREQQRVVANMTIEMPIQGNPELQPGLAIQTQDIAQDETLPVTVTLSNFGNVITYYDLELIVSEAGQQQGMLEYPQPIQVLPGEQQEITLTYTDTLPPGDYTVTLDADVNNQEQLTQTAPFVVTLNTQTETIQQGEDLVIELKRYNSQPRVRYTVAQQGEIQLQEALVADQDTLTILTSSLAEGEYDVEIQLTSAERTETQSFVLDVRSAQLLPSWTMYVLILAALIAFFFSKTTRTHIKLTILAAKIHRREKRLNSLIHRAHVLEERT